METIITFFLTAASVFLFVATGVLVLAFVDHIKYKKWRKTAHENDDWDVFKHRNRGKKW